MTETNFSETPADFYRELARVIATLDRWPKSDPDGLMRQVLDEFSLLTGSSCTAVFLAIKVKASEDDSLLGWRPGPSILRDASKRQMIDKWTSYPANYLKDPGMRALAKGAGITRCTQFGEIEGWETSPVAGLVRELGFKHRIMATHATAPSVEVTFVLDRRDSQERYTEADEARILAFLEAGAMTFKRWAMTYGLCRKITPLSPRLRETLLHLLTPLSEKEIAAQMSLTERSAHQYVVQVYRALQVRSRPELMALWLNTHEATLT